MVSLLALATASPAIADLIVFINELHYDNAGADTGEFVEIAGPAGTDLTGWSVSLYTGSNGGVYDTIALAGTLPNQQNGYGAASFFRAGIQNGAPDGLALINDSGIVLQFLSYEGMFVATDGPANGLLSADIGVSELSSTPIGSSLQLVGTGRDYGDFSWSAPSVESPGQVNARQNFRTASVPDSGATSALLAMGLTAIPLLRRKKRAA